MFLFFTVSSSFYSALLYTNKKDTVKSDCCRIVPKFCAFFCMVEQKAVWQKKRTNCSTAVAASDINNIRKQIVTATVT